MATAMMLLLENEEWLLFCESAKRVLKIIFPGHHYRNLFSQFFASSSRRDLFRRQVHL